MLGATSGVEIPERVVSWSSERYCKKSKQRGDLWSCEIGKSGKQTSYSFNLPLYPKSRSLKEIDAGVL